MDIHIYTEFFKRDLDKLIAEIESYKLDENLWLVDGDIKNSSGNLCLHIIGNLQYFIGSIIGKTGYIRNREAEFSSKNVPKTDLLFYLNETKEVVIRSLENFDQVKLQQDYPIDVFGKKMTFEYFIVHLITHLNYHLGQINYLRRITDH